MFSLVYLCSFHGNNFCCIYILEVNFTHFPNLHGRCQITALFAPALARCQNQSPRDTASDGKSKGKSGSSKKPESKRGWRRRGGSKKCVSSRTKFRLRCSRGRWLWRWPRASRSTGSGVFASGAIYTAFTDIASLAHLPRGTAFPRAFDADVPSVAQLPGWRAVPPMGWGGHPFRCANLPSTHTREAAHWKGGRLREEPAACSACDLGKFQVLKISTTVLFCFIEREFSICVTSPWV